jgi:hypothetical protein
LHIGFSHKITHKDSAAGTDWDFERKYHPGLQLRILGYRFVDVEGTIALADGATTIIDKDRLEKLSSLFIKKDPEKEQEEGISYAQQVCQPNGINTPILTISANVCAVGTVGLEWDVSVISLSPPFAAPFAESKSVAGLDVSLGPFTTFTLVGHAVVDLAVLKGELAVQVDLIKVLLSHQMPDGEYIDGAGFSVTTAAMSESEILATIGTEGLLEERVLDGKVRLLARIPAGIEFVGYFEPRVKWKKKDWELYSWQGIVLDRQRLWKLDTTDSIEAAVISMP